MLKGPYRVISETIVADERPPSPSRGRRGQSVRWVLLFEKFSGKLGRSKSQRLVTVPYHKCYQLGFKPSGRGQCAEGAAALEPISAPACNRELPRIPLLRGWVNRGLTA